MPCFLGLDVSTTATKALLADAAGRVLGTAAAPHALATPRPLWSEQDPAGWWVAAQAAIRRVLAETGTPGEAVAAAGLTGQMHGLVALDAGGAVLRPAILWNDQRAAAECATLREAVGGRARLVALTGNDAFPGFTAPKLLWMRRHEPDRYARIGQVLLPKDYVRYRLTGAYATDRAGAGGTLLLDLRTRDWSPAVCDALEVPLAWLPPTHEGPEATGAVTAAAAAATGLRAGTPVVAGGGDQAAQAVGVGAARPGVWALTLGTSGVVFAPSDAPRADPAGRAHAFPHAVPGRWHLMGVMLSAAGSLQWYRDTLAPGTAFDALLAEAEAAPPGCDGLAFLPYLSGERTPHADPDARGAFVGLTLAHHRGHLTRAVLEGVAFGLKDNLRLLQAAGLPLPQALRLSGGGARSPFWRRLLADVLGVPMAVTNTSEGAAYGAALLAAVGAGAWPSVEAACTAACTVQHVTEPQAPDRYAEAYARFQALYPALREASIPAARA